MFDVGRVCCIHGELEEGKRGKGKQNPMLSLVIPSDADHLKNHLRLYPGSNPAGPRKRRFMKPGRGLLFYVEVRYY
jgi:hypothetical protein